VRASAVGRLVTNNLTELGKNLDGDPVLPVAKGELDAQALLHADYTEPRLWYVRLACLLGCALGFAVFIAPLKPLPRLLGGKLPLLGAAAIGLLLAVASLGLAAATPWTQYKPLIGGGLVAAFLLGPGALYLLLRRAQARA
jgi:hypothetical protein